MRSTLTIILFMAGLGACWAASDAPVAAPAATPETTAPVAPARSPKPLHAVAGTHRTPSAVGKGSCVEMTDDQDHTICMPLTTLVDPSVLPRTVN